MIIILKNALTQTEFVSNIQIDQVTNYEHRKRWNEVIRTNVRDIRLAKGITGSHVARALAVSRQSYQSMETGQCEINAERLRVLSKVLDVNVEVFFDRKLTESVLEEIRGAQVVRG